MFDQRKTWIGFKGYYHLLDLCDLLNLKCPAILYYLHCVSCIRTITLIRTWIHISEISLPIKKSASGALIDPPIPLRIDS